MPIFARSITTEENAELTALTQSDDEVTRRRASCIIMSSQGQTTAQIAGALSLSERTARNTVSAFNQQGMQSVGRAAVPGRPRRLSDVPTDAIRQLLCESPREHGIDSDYWSLESFASALANAFGLGELSRDTIGRELRRRGVDWLQEKQAYVVTPHSTMGARPGNLGAAQAAVEKHNETPSRSGKYLYADRLLGPEEQESYDAVIKNLRSEFSVGGGIEEMHIQLAALYFMRLVQAQADEDWDKAEHIDRMLKNQMSELRAMKKKQESQVSQLSGLSPAEWASELLERYRAAVADGYVEDTDVSIPDMSNEEGRALLDAGYARWRRNKLAQRGGQSVDEEPEE